MDATRLRCSSIEEEQPKREELLVAVNDCICVSIAANSSCIIFL